MERCNTNAQCNEEKHLLFTKNGYSIYECGRCRRRFSIIPSVETHLSDVYSDEYFFGGGHGYPNYLEGTDILINKGIYYAEVVKRYTKPLNILDIGCAAGFILKGFEQSGWNCHGIEPNETMARYGRNELDLDIYTGSMETFTTDSRFDLISLIQVIGHFYDIHQAIEKVSQLLTPNGIVLVESWNMKSFVARILGKNWHEYSPPSVINWFSDTSIAMFFNTHGFELVKSGLPVKYIKVNHALSLLDEHTPQIIYKKQIIEFLSRKFGNNIFRYPPVDLKWYIFRKL
jgi:SAM-dependent methyltransferase